MMRLALGVCLALSVAAQSYAATGYPSGGVDIEDDGTSKGQARVLDMTTGLTCVTTATALEIDCSADIFSAPQGLYVAGHNSTAKMVNVADEYQGTGTQAALTVWGTRSWVGPLGSGLGTHIRCDGSNDYVSFADHADLEPSGNLSWSFWIRPMLSDEQEASLAAGTSMAIFSKRENATIPYVLWLVSGASTIDGRFGLLFYGNGGGTSVTTPDVLTNFPPLNTDPNADQRPGHHVVITLNASTGEVKVYVDGSLVITETDSAWSMLNSAQSLKLCASYSGSAVSDYATIGLDNFRMYNSLLSQTDVDTLYAAGAGVSCGTLTTSLNLCADFSEGTGTTVEDDGPLGTDQDGTLNGFAAPATAASGWALCRLAGCFHFDGTNDHLIVRDIADLDWTTAETMTLEADVRSADATTTTDTRTIVSKGDRGTGNTNYTLELVTGSDEVRFAYGRAACDAIADTWTSTNFNNVGGTLAGVAIVYTFGTGSTFEMYKVDAAGTATAVTGAWDAGGESGDGDAAPCVNTEPLYIAAEGPSLASLFLGSIGNLQFWRADHGTTGQIQTDMTTRCTGTGTGKEVCWPMDDGQGNLVAQLADQAGIGNDAANCTSTVTPCRTIAGALAKWPQLFNANAVMTIAPGIYPELVPMRGFRPAETAEIALRGRYGAVNTFGADVARISGSTSGGNTANFPQTTKSLFNDTTNPFTTTKAVDEGWLEITTGAGTGFDGYCLGSGLDARNWYPIEARVSNSQIQVATKWYQCGLPQTATYKVYSADDGVEIHGGKIRDAAISIEDSAGISLQKLALSGAISNNLYTNSTLEQIAVVKSSDAEYVAYQLDAGAVVHDFTKYMALDSYAGVNVWASETGSLFDGIASRNLNGGVGYYFGAFAKNWLGPLHCENNGYACLDVENASQSYNLSWLRAECASGGYGIIAAANTNLNATQRFTITSGSGNCATALLVSSGSEFLTNMQGGETNADVQIQNSTVGILLAKNGLCNNCSQFTQSGVTTHSNNNNVGYTTSPTSGTIENVPISGVGSGRRLHVTVSGATAAFNFGGFLGLSSAPPMDGDELILDNITAYNMGLLNESAGTTAGYRITTTTGVTVSTTGPGVCVVRYSYQRTRWVLISCAG